jgi:prenyltransferase beta subunit
MRLSLALVFLLPSLAFAQPTAEQKKETIKWITALQDPNGGFYLAPQDPNIDALPRPSLRATSGAARALKYLGAEVPNKEKHAAFVLKCYDPKTGGFTEPGGKPDVTITSIGVMAAAALDIPKKDYAKAMDYLKENAKTFEEVRIGAAAVEAWGVKDCPFKLDEWFKVATNAVRDAPASAEEGGARAMASIAALFLRLEEKLPEKEFKKLTTVLHEGQRADGGWGKVGEKASDIETTYRVMRTCYLLAWAPPDLLRLRKFINSHRNKDGGYATKPGEKSSMSGVYYCVIVSKWLDEMEKK